MVRFLTVLAPIVLLAIWGLSYIGSCLLFLSAPGHPFQLKYKSPGGELTLLGDSYAFDAKHGFLRVDGARIVDPSGAEIVTVDQVGVTGLTLPINLISVRANSVKGEITRLKSGRLDFQSYLPPSQGPPSNLPFAVMIKEAAIDINDLAGRTPYRRKIHGSDVDVRGAGEQWIASSDVVIDRTGSARVSVQSLPNEGYLVQARSSKLALDDLLQHLRDAPERKSLGPIRDLQVRNLTATGPASVFIPTKSPLRFQFELDAAGDNIRYQEYRADHATFRGRIDDQGIVGMAVARQGTVHANFKGSASWSKTFSIGGDVAATAPSKRAVPAYLSKFFPKDIDFSGGRIKGYLSYNDHQGFALDSRFAANSGVVYGQSISRPDLDLYVERGRVRVGVNQATWSNTPVSGAISIGVGQNQIVGEFRAKKASLATLASRFGASGLQGTADASVLISGQTSNPTAVLQVDGNASYPVNGKRINGRFRAAANYVSNVVNVQRATMRTDVGFLRAVGRIYLNGSKLQLRLEANGVQLAKLRDDLEGNVTASGVLDGTFRDPRFHGRAVALAVEAAGETIPFASSDISATRQRLQATNLRVVKGTGEATGDLALNLKSKGLDGALHVNNLLLNEYFGEDALGVVNIPNLSVGGTLSHPTAAGDAYGENLLLGGIQVDSVKVKSSLDGKVAKVESAEVKVGDGAITASGSYNYETKTGVFDVAGDNLSLARITPPGKGAANITGLLGGKGQVTIHPNASPSAALSGTLKDVVLNNTDFGSGNWKLGYDLDELTAEASVGKLDRFFLLENLKYQTKTAAIAAQVSVLNGAIGDLYTAAKPFFGELPSNSRDLLDNLSGDVDTTVAISGKATNPDLDVKLLEARNLVLKNENLGTITAAATKTDELWKVSQLRWSGPQGDLYLTKPATIDTGGDLLVDAELKRFDLRYVSLVAPSLANLRGLADISLLATGSSDKPSIHASVATSENSSIGFDNSQETFRVMLDSIQIDPSVMLENSDFSGGIRASGKFFYRGITGDLNAKIPFRYPFEIPEGAPLTAELTLPNIDLEQVAQYANALDTARSRGSLNGRISLTGPLSNLGLSGQLTSQASSLALTGIQTALTNADMQLELKGNTIQFSMKADGSEGGNVLANLTATVPDLRTTIDQILKAGGDDLLNIPLVGSIRTEDFAVREAGSKKEYGQYHADVSADLSVNGPLKQPLISGPVNISNTNVLLPSVFEEGGPPAELLFNPQFQIPIVLNGVSTFSSSLANVALTGDGLLSGSLARPDFNATLNVEGGQLRLPTARVQLEEGGTIRPSYSIDSTGQTLTRVDVNLQGRTAVTANKLGDSITRYNINLDISGDLLKEGGLVLHATSDPPDLSQDEILGLLGQTDILKSFESGTSQSETERRIREALVSFAVPQLTERFTSQIARGLGLDYLNIEYNPFEGASLAFAKSIGKGLVLQGRRQVSPQVGNLKVQYDLELTYRIPTRNRTLNRLVFSIGLDQDRPYKLGIQYGFRF